MHADRPVTLAGSGEYTEPWVISPLCLAKGGDQIAAREAAPLGRVLPYRRARGASPPRTALGGELHRRGWRITLPDTSLGDTLLGLAAAAGLSAVTAGEGAVRYRGPRPGLLSRCTLPMAASTASGPHILGTGGGEPVDVPVIPESPPTWLDLLDNAHVQVHAALPMRYYLLIEQAVGVRLPADTAPVPSFRTWTELQPGHVVFVGTTSHPERKDYGTDGFASIARALTERRCDLQYSLITPANGTRAWVASHGSWYRNLGGLDALDCLDVFGSAELVIGNDTGLTHLAALTERADGSSPQVVGLYSRHSFTKWTTGRTNHHAIATAWSAMLSAADRCPARDELDETVWGAAAAIASLPPAAVAHAAGQWAGWW